MRRAFVSLPNGTTSQRARTPAVTTPEHRAEEFEFTLILREQPGTSLAATVAKNAPLPPHQRRFRTVNELTAAHGHSDSDRDRVLAWARNRGFTLVLEDATTRRMRFRGTAAAVDAEFRAGLRRFTAGTTEHWCPTTPLMLGGGLRDAATDEPIVTTVLGLNRTPMRPKMRPATTPTRIGHDPEEFARARNVPSLPNGGDGTTIFLGIMELGGKIDPVVAHSFLTQPKYRNLSLWELGLNGAVPTSEPGPMSPDTEVAGDWQVMVRTVLEANPRAKVHCIVAYGTSDDQGFHDSLAVFISGKGVTSSTVYDRRSPGGRKTRSGAVDPTRVTAVSCSWGLMESQWLAASSQAIEAVAQQGKAVGIPMFIASGDIGSTCGRSDGKLDADMPAACPSVVAVGGLQVILDGSGAITSESVWNQVATGQGAGGGGVTRVFPVPAYQAGTPFDIPAADDSHRGRVEPDLSESADPLHGYNIVLNDQASGIHNQVYGGTSFATPLVAAGFACASAVLGTRLGSLHEALYGAAQAKSAAVTPVTTGNNAYPAGALGYPAGPGSTGVGALDFTKFLADLSVSRPPVTPPSTPSQPDAGHDGLAA